MSERVDEKQSAKPDIEYFYNIPVKGFCGSCGRCLFLVKRGQTKEDLMKLVKACKYCGRVVDWTPKSGKEY